MKTSICAVVSLLACSIWGLSFAFTCIDRRSIYMTQFPITALSLIKSCKYLRLKRFFICLSNRKKAFKLAAVEMKQSFDFKCVLQQIGK